MWQERGGKLYREFKFKDFTQAFGFMSQVAEAAAAQNHHPKWTNEYNEVEIWLSTHSAGDKITDKDKALAKAIDAIFENYS
jgi:4a-hydroxytetrahydrobiopterin dehydratase